MILNHSGTQTIETEILVLRKFDFLDAEDMLKYWISDPDVQNNYGEPVYNNIDDVRQLLNMWISSYESSDFYRWAIMLKETKTNIGQIAFYVVDSKNQKADVEYCISKSYWGNGYAAEALKALIQYAFEQIHFNRVEAFHRSKNIASGKVLQKAGMKPEGILKQASFHNDCFDDRILYGIVKEDWLKDK